MPLFPFVSMPDRVRKDALGPVTLNQLAANAEAVQQLSLREHATDGTHNALEVPRVMGRSVWGGASYTDYLFSESAYWTSNANPAVGEITLTIGATGFSYPYMPVLACCCDEDVLNKPWMVVAKVTSATSVSLYLSKLSSALGAGNTWAAADGSYSVALHSPPVAQAAVLSTIAAKQRRGFLTEGTTDWNALVALQGGLRKLALTKHTTAGEHDDALIAREYAHVTYDSVGVKYDLTAGDVASVSRISTGICEVTTSRTFSATTAMAAFVQDLPTSNTSLWVVNYRITSTTTLRVYLYQYDFNTDTWARADGDFFVAVYGN